jgi:D-arabinose 1-dehydrogenase-like Zn-dependent alcohol dehydrogenase
MCAGQTVFVPLWRNKVKKGDRVGVIGIGGLGHLAIQFAAAWGCEVIVFSSSDSKKEEALGFGAKEFWNTNTMTGDGVGKLNHLIVTTSRIPDWSMFVPTAFPKALSVLKPSRYANLMAPFGHIYPLTIQFGTPFTFPYEALVLKELSITGSCSSSMEEIREMLNFVVTHNIRPTIVKFPMSVDGISDALKQLDAGSIRYRAVLEV